MSDWKTRAVDMAEKLQDSHVYAGIVTENFIKDPTCALQIGYAVLMDKPIALICDRTMKVPKHLIKIAERIEYVDMKSEADLKRAVETLKNMAEGV